MHDIEPHFNWRDHYTSAEDERSPFFGRQYSEFQFSQKIYNYYIHPQWDNFGSSTLYLKILFADYDNHFAIIELIGEWNDCLHNDIRFLKREVIDLLIEQDIHKFVLMTENVLNFHSGDDDYYEEWWDDISEEGGWIVLLDSLQHVIEEMQTARLQHYINFGTAFNDIGWRKHKPLAVFKLVEKILNGEVKQLTY